jgi:hypothetical protein
VRRVLLSIALVAAFGVPCWADGTVANPESLIELNVTPAAAPTPAFRYLLLPELREMKPGNPVQQYMKCMMEQQSFFFDKESFDRRERLLAMPLKELPAQDLQEYGNSILTQVDWAARLDNPDWQILSKLKIDGFGLLIPEVQQLRGLARALRVRFRAEVALGRFDDAIRTAQTMFAMSRHLSENPIFIANLVGIAIASVAVEPLEELIQQPGCPNLYWALTSLPSPLVPIAKGVEGERSSLEWVCRDLDERAPMTAEQIKTYIDFVDKMLGDGNAAKPNVRAMLDKRIKEPGRVSAARKRLVEYGLKEELLNRFPADQVILLDEKRELEVRFDELRKTVVVPFWQGEALAAAIPSKENPEFFADAFLPSVRAVHIAQARIDQRIALLRHVEALRLFAAEHKGALPGKLSEISVPLPDDPYTGKPFRYELNGSTAHLRGSPPKGFEKLAVYNIHYALKLQK